MRPFLLLAALAAGCVPDPCATARRNVSLGVVDATTNAIVQPVVRVDGETPQDLVCARSMTGVETVCARVAFTLIGSHEIEIGSDGFQPRTLMVDGGFLVECGRQVPAVDVETTVKLTPEVTK
jgi:hypothetical protein